MSIFSSYKKIFLLGFIVVILIAIPFSVYIAQKRQSISSKAAASTTLSFDPSSPTIKVGETLTLGIILNPASGSATPNQVSFVKLSISFDAEKFTAESLKPNTVFPNTLTFVLEDSIDTSGTASISLSVGADPTKVLTTKTKIAVLKLKALSQTDNDNPSSITFDKITQVLSIAASDQTSDNVLSTTTPAIVTINPGPSVPSSISTAITTPSPTTTPSPSSIIIKTTPSPAQTAGTTGLGAGTAAAELIPIIAPQVPQALPTTAVFLPIESKGGLPPTGPGEKILGIGIIGVIFTLIGGALFILL